LRAKGAFSPRSFSGWRDRSLLMNAWRIGGNYQVNNAATPVAASSWGTAQTIPAGETGSWILQPIPFGSPPPNEFRADMIEAVLFDVTTYSQYVLTQAMSIPAHVIADTYSETNTGSLTYPSTFLDSNGTYTFTGSNGTTAVTGAGSSVVTTTESVSGTGSLSVPVVAPTGSTTYPGLSYQRVGISLYDSVLGMTNGITVQDPLNPTVMVGDTILDYALDTFLQPKEVASFSGRSWSVSLPNGYDFQVDYGVGNALVVTFSNSSSSVSSMVILPYIRVLGELH
jgi:hypothetical protein